MMRGFRVVLGVSSLAIALIPGMVWGEMPGVTQELAQDLRQQTASRSQGGEAAPFRVGNRSNHPVRVVILKRRGNGDPAHWDFAPGEGGSEGLLLSLEEDPLVLQPGDVVVSFALDGSRRYWGPNIVGESVAPFWDPVRRIWSMILQP